MLAELRSSGFTVIALDGGRLSIKPRPSAELLARAIASKPEILRELGDEAKPPQNRFAPWSKDRAAPYSPRRIRNLQRRRCAGSSWW